MQLFRWLSVGVILTALPFSCSSSFLPTYVEVGEGTNSQVTATALYNTLEEGVGHFSQWSKSTKRAFVDDVRAGKAQDWVIVMGNEGGGELSRKKE